jgi:uncharacterized protein YdhG (YjbR/CyaY superfamily)
MGIKPNSIDEYMAAFPPKVQEILQQIRTLIKETAPEAEEAISYGIPTFKLKKTNLVHFAAYKSHIGFYPTPSGVEAFAEAFKPYKTGKGSVQFPLEQPMPFDLIAQIVAYRIKNLSDKNK